MKTLLTFLPHMAAFDSCFPLVERLAQRGVVQTETLLGPRLRQTEPRAVTVAEASAARAREASLLGLEVFSLGRLRRADAILTHSDPVAYGKRTRLRDAYTLRLNKPVVFVQHGMFQLGLTYTLGGRRWGYHADLMLLWQELAAAERAEIFEADPGARIVTTGLLKVNRLPVRPLPQTMAARVAAARQVVLIAHNYGHEGANYDGSARDRAFSQWQQVFDARPDTLFILRSHRGRKHKTAGDSVDRLVGGRANVVVSERHEGDLKFTTINDVLAVADRVVTHPSTVVLDALSEGVPVGILDNNRAVLDPLAQIADAGDFLAFIDDAKPMEQARQILDTYGEVERNLDAAAQAVEDWMARL